MKSVGSVWVRIEARSVKYSVLAFVLLATMISGGGLQAASAASEVQPGSIDYELVLREDMAIYVAPAEGIGRVRYYVDPSARDLEAGLTAARPAVTVTRAPFAWGKAAGFDASALASGSHVLVAAVDLVDGRTLVKSARIVRNSGGTALLHGAETTGTVAAAVPNADCTPLDCSQVKVGAPYVLGFDQNHGGLLDKNGLGTGFTWVDKPTAGGTGYIPANLEVDTAAGVLKITTTAGIAYLESNNQDNALGVGINAASQISVLETRLVNIPTLTGELEQAGLWYGLDDDNYLKLVLISLPDGPRVQFVEERNGVEPQQVVSPMIPVTGSTVLVQMRANPVRRSVTGLYSVNGGPLQELSTFTVPTALFNGSGAVVDPTVGTAVFGGVFATDRFLQGVTVFQFDYFSFTAASLVARRYLPIVVSVGP